MSQSSETLSLISEPNSVCSLVELSSRVGFFVCSVYIHIPVTPGPKMRAAPSQLKSSLSHVQDICNTHACIYALWRKGRFFNKLSS